MRKSLLTDNPWFAANLAWLLDQRGMNNAQLSGLLGVSRQAVHSWRQGINYPDADKLQALCVALRCSEDDLLSEARPAGVRVLTLPAWAKREAIPTSRARDLFALGLLRGEQHTAFGILVPARLRAPKDSKQRVLMAKRRPRWVRAFHRNFPPLMRKAKLKCWQIGAETGVQPAAVLHWLHGRNYPKQERLPRIAEVLGVALHELTGHLDAVP